MGQECLFQSQLEECISPCHDIATRMTQSRRRERGVERKYEVTWMDDLLDIVVIWVDIDEKVLWLAVKRRAIYSYFVGQSKEGMFANDGT